MPDGQSGFLAVNKSPGITSYGVIRLAKQILKTKKIGHSGTLDAPAAGVLVLGIGKATRLLQFITALPKRYTAELVLGTATDTGDNEGQTIAAKDMGNIEMEDLKNAAQNFVGEIEQIPPMYSAKKVDGKRLHQLAREGKTVKLKPQNVKIHSLEIEWLDQNEGIAFMEVKCSAGTYIRTLGADIAEKLGGVGHIRNLKRISVGSFHIDNCISLESFLDTEPPDLIRPPDLISMPEGLADYPQYLFTNSADIEFLQNGRSLDKPADLNLENKILDPPICSALNQNGELLAICEISKSSLQPKVVIPNK